MQTRAREGDDLQEVPVFGVRVEGCPYIVRPSAYALVRNASGEVAVVQTPRGCFLPGGGIETGESPERAAEREAMEECGLVIDSLGSVGTAVELVHAPEEHACFEKQCTFLTARLLRLAPVHEANHALAWLTLEDAIRRLSHGSHRWAVGRIG